ncbi:hypothetical protein [uncultured Alteromonas sp.]|jgi:hypothetical protein|uniref:hypothetical protein n=1 Tax=uncultured Alteromonas sp. TaxID=179113 RepID=UPI0025F500FF|nr:hypothetical protein [uncultured Alteromonas sp.]
MTPNDRILALVSRLTAQVSPNVVSRNYQDVDRFEERDKAIFVVISGGFPQFGGLFDEEDERHEVMILVQQYVADGTSGGDREALEFGFINTIRQLVKEDGTHNAPLNLEMKKAHSSRQMDPNHAWVVVELEFNDL